MQRKKTKPTYKQMSFETAVRNPERYKGILTAIYPFNHCVLDDQTLLQIVSSLYLAGIVSSEEVIIKEYDTTERISSAVVAVNSTRKADGGFPQGYQSRFWTYMRTLSELGFVFAQYKECLQFSEIAIMLINNKLDEQEAFSIQAMKYNRRSPYRNVSNDFNFFKFIIDVLKVKERISREQFIVSEFSMEGNVNDFISEIANSTFNNNDQVFDYVVDKYKTNNNRTTIVNDYPDVVLRVLLITGLLSIKYVGKVFLTLNLDKIDLINDLLKVDITLTDDEKNDAIKHFKKLETYNKALLSIIFDYRTAISEIDGFNYSTKMLSIIHEYNLTQEIIVESINYIGTSRNIVPAFKYIAEPLKLEFYLSLMIALLYGKEFAIRPNYKADYLGLPISHAPANTGDIEVYSKKVYWLIEVTLIRNKTQQLNSETTSVIRHFLEDNKLNEYISKYLSFVAPVIHQDTKDYFDYSVVIHKIKEKNFSLKPYSIAEFVSITLAKTNFKDMDDYTKEVIEAFRKNLL